MLATVLFVPSASADWTSFNTSDPSYDEFTSSSSNDSRVAADVQNFLSYDVGLQDWQNVAKQIRSGGTKALCTGNLSIALSELGVSQLQISLLVRCPAGAYDM
jgi:hypothetical protein